MHFSRVVRVINERLLLSFFDLKPSEIQISQRHQIVCARFISCARDVVGCGTCKLTRQRSKKKLLNFTNDETRTTLNRRMRSVVRFSHLPLNSEVRHVLCVTWSTLSALAVLTLGETCKLG
jgi:hypothetical protein